MNHSAIPCFSDPRSGARGPARLGRPAGPVRLGRAEGAELIGGERLGQDGFFLTPALFLGASNAMRVSREEIFGPVAA